MRQLPNNALEGTVIVGKHRNNLRMPDLARMRDQLEHATGLSIAELADLTKRWPA